MINKYFINQTASTNSLLADLVKKQSLPEGFVAYTDFQTSGKGQGGNTWESEKGKNLLFSMLLYPQMVPIEEQFIISQIVSVAIQKLLSEYFQHVKIKWPNDIYINNSKIAGILIENSLRGSKINYTIIGIGLNVNQTNFRSDAPNPVSMRQIKSKSFNREKILERIVQSILSVYSEMNYESIRQSYFDNLFRKDGSHKYRSGNQMFNALIEEVKPNGELILCLENGTEKSFSFKEVEFVV